VRTGGSGWSRGIRAISRPISLEQRGRALVHESKSARVLICGSDRHAACFCEIGIASDDIRFNMLHAVIISTRCALELRARRHGPKTLL
jgi:hypothetical protein